MKQLNEKVAIITGGGQGIGKGIATCLAKRGVNIVITGRRPGPIEESIEEIKALGVDGLALPCDSSDRDRVKEVVEETASTFGTVDVLVNNAQAVGPSAPVEETTYDAMYLAWSTGCIGSLNFMQECFPYMKEQHEGRVINFASATGMFGYAGQLAYASNKEAVRGLTKIAAKEWGEYGICVNCILPSSETPASKEWAKKFPEMYEEEMKKKPMGRMGDPENDIGPVVAFLSGPDSCFYSGQCMLVDGASSIAP
ncbi:MAG: SDR family oxidoreductase [Coriobacteriaceae bacterium]|nr:SDR family oxidoreductase [Coriobacteriaceae bacterium]